MKRILLVVGSILLINFLAICQATAECNEDPDITFKNPLCADNIWELIDNLIDFIYTISIPLLVIAVLWAGFTMITAGGKAENFKKGQNILLYAAIGFAIILLSKGVSLIIADLLNAGVEPPQQSEEPTMVPPPQPTGLII